VIISAEIHCSIEQQDMIVGILKSVFGEMLVCAPLEGRRREGEELPSPEELRGRILVKVRLREVCRF
jgi:phosphatidylinositol phospholipase C delta